MAEKKNKVKLWLTRENWIGVSGKLYLIWEKKPIYRSRGWESSGLYRSDYLISICPKRFNKIFPKSFHLKGGHKSLIQIEVKRVK